jgi:formiminoglutamase
MKYSHDTSLLFSRGEPDDPRLGEVAQMVSLNDFEKRSWDWAIIGLPDDRGVALNGGRIGAALGPAAIRKWFYRLVPPCDVALADLGDMEMTDDLHADHDRAAEAIAIALGSASRVAILGGGHDWGFAPIAALMQGGSVGFVNFDAHLDVRPSKAHHSGTSYWRALEAGVKGENAAWFGVQSASTAEAHRQYVEAHGGCISWADGPSDDRDCITLMLEGHSENQYDYLDVSLDMDVIAMADAPGVSAPQPLGLQAYDLFSMLSTALSLSHVRTFGIYETAPPLDLPGEPTSRLAARCLWEALAASQNNR